MPPRFEGCEQVERIGRGGFGIVYRAWQPAFRRRVAVKVLAVGTSDDVTIRRFQREVAAVGSLSGHPNIVVVHDIGTTDEGDPYLVMAYLAGGTLSDRLIDAGPLSWKEVASWGVKLAGALEAAHRAGVLHLDVKPDNVLFDEFDEPQLVDFGIARLEGVTHSRSANVKATPLYAAPEVLGGARPTPAADVYSLAATMYAVLRGRPAFLSDTDETMAPMLTRVLTESPEPLGEDLVPAALWAVLAQSLAKEPAARQGSALAFGEGLQAAQAGAGESVTTITVPEVAVDARTDTVIVDEELQWPTPESGELTRARNAALPKPPVPPLGEPSPGARRRRRWPGVAAAGVIVVLAAAAALLLLTDEDEPTGPRVADIEPSSIDPAAPGNPAASIPAARPTELTATLDGGDVALSWVNHAPSARGVAVQQGRRVLTVLEPTETAIVIEDVDASGRVCFLVGSVGAGSDASWVEEPACAVSGPPAAAEDLIARRGQGGNVALRWSDLASNEQGYRILQDGEPIPGPPEEPGTTAKDLSNVAQGAEVCFTVVAFNEQGDAPSEEVCVSPR